MLSYIAPNPGDIKDERGWSGGKKVTDKKIHLLAWRKKVVHKTFWGKTAEMIDTWV